jgi:glycosyltransferase involved in cell wall biosynthesis
MESVVKQSFEDVEIIAIDAGSTDGTWEILQEYEGKDSRVRLIHSDKKSYGYQLNLGIRLASGRYIGIVETDDYIEKDMYKTLYENMVLQGCELTNSDEIQNAPNEERQNGYDYVKGTAEAFREISRDIQLVSEIRSFEEERVILNPSENPELFSIDRFLWLGLYKAELLKKIQLNETPGAAYQDIGFNFKVFSSSVKALYLNKVVYHYRQDNMDASGYDSKAFQYLFDEYKKILDRNISNEWLGAVYKKMAGQCLARFCNMASNGQYWEGNRKEIETLGKWLGNAEREGVLTEKSMGENNWDLLRLWMKGSDVLYRYLKKVYEERLQRVRECFCKIGDKEIVIFGAGKYGKFFHALSENRYPGKVVAYCDNRTDLAGTLLQGVAIVEPSQAVTSFYGAVFVITVSNDAEGAYEQLLQLGLEEKKIVKFKSEYDYTLLGMSY